MSTFTEALVGAAVDLAAIVSQADLHHRDFLEAAPVLFASALDDRPMRLYLGLVRGGSKWSLWCFTTEAPVAFLDRWEAAQDAPSAWELLPSGPRRLLERALQDRLQLPDGDLDRILVEGISRRPVE